MRGGDEMQKIKLTFGEMMIMVGTIIAGLLMAAVVGKFFS